MDDEVNVELVAVNSNENVRKNDEDYVAKCVGEFGVWQAGACAISSLTRYVSMWNMFSILFLTPVTNFKCASFERNLTVDVENNTCYENCERYHLYNDIFVETLTSEFVLICDNAWKASLSQTIMMFGLLVGVFLFGWISDRHGRRKSLLSSFLINVLLMLMVGLSPCYWVFISLRFLIGIATGGTLNTGAVYMLEIVGPRYRELAGAFALLPDAFAEASLTIFAYYSPNWRIYSMGYGIVSVIFFIPMVLLPETPRWLISKDQVDNAVEVLTRIAKFNKRDTSQILINIEYAVGDITAKIVDQSSYLDFLKTKFNVLAITIIWTSAGACYFGINQYVTFLGNDLLTTVIILGLIQIPGYLIALVINKLSKRRIGLLLPLFTIGTSMIIMIFLPKDHWAYKYLSLLAVAACAALYYVIYVFTAEMFPTSTRNMAYGVGAAGAKIGSMVVPFIITLTPYWVPSSIFAVMVFTSSVFIVFLPETKGMKLKDNA